MGCNEVQKTFFFSQIVESLDYMNCKFANPYIIFYSIRACNSMALPINRSISVLQGDSLDNPWRGNIVVTKYSNGKLPFSSLIETFIADFAVIKNYFLIHGYPQQVSSFFMTLGLLQPNLLNNQWLNQKEDNSSIIRMQKMLKSKRPLTGVWRLRGCHLNFIIIS